MIFLLACDPMNNIPDVEILGIYSDIPSVLATDLRVGQIVENTPEAWRDAQENIYTTDYLLEVEICWCIRPQCSLDLLDHQLWWPKVLLDTPLSASLMSS